MKIEPGILTGKSKHPTSCKITLCGGRVVIWISEKSVSISLDGTEQKIRFFPDMIGNRLVDRKIPQKTKTISEVIAGRDSTASARLMKLDPDHALIDAIYNNFRNSVRQFFKGEM